MSTLAAPTTRAFTLAVRSEPARLASLRVLLGDAVFSLVAGVIIALPWNATARALLRAQSPDQTIFRDDPIELVELVLRPAGQTALLVGLAVTLTAVWIISFIPFGVVLSNINTRPAEAPRGVRGALAWHFSHSSMHYARTVSTGAAFGLVRILWLALAGGCAALAHGVLYKGNNDARTTLVTGAVFVIVAMGVVPITALEDCVHAARFRGTPEVIRPAFAALRASFARLCASLALRYALALLLMVLGLVLLRGSLGSHALLVFGVHQVFFFARAATRAWWLAVASQAVARVSP